MLKIGFDAKRAFLNATGLGNYARGVIRGLARRHRGNAYYLYTPSLGGLDEAAETAALPGVATVLPTGAARLAKSAWRSGLLARRVARDGLDLYHGLSHELPLGLKRSGIPGIVTIHDMLPFRHPQYFPRIDGAVYRAKFGHAVRTAARVVAVSGQTARDVTEFLGAPPERLSVVHQGVHPLFHRPGDPERDEALRRRLGLPGDFILTVGSIIPRKNLLGLIRALAQLPTGTDPVLAVAGKGGDYERRARAEAERLGLGERVRFLGHVGLTDLPSLYRLATVTAYPSFYEGFGIPVLESLTCATPVVTSTGTCFAESGGAGALYADPAKPEEIAAALAKVLEDSGLAADLSRKGLAHAATFGEDVLADAMMDVYREVLGS